jgi:hypothetical protein
MKKNYFLIYALLISSLSIGQDLIITGVFDGPLSGGTPKGIELYAVNDISDLSQYGIGSANNGGGSDGVELVLSGIVSADNYIYVASEQPQFNAFFGFNPDFTGSAVNINGDDAIELFKNGSVIDTFGNINIDGSGTAWDYEDGWAYRLNGTGPDGSTFVLANWGFSGINMLEGEGVTNNNNAPSPFPIGSYSTATASVNRSEILNFSIYPNPLTSGKLYINTNSNSEKNIQIFDVLGKKVFESNLKGRELDLTKLTAGIYILKVLEEGKTATRKLVIK